MLGKGLWRVLRGHGTPACDSDFGLRALVHLTSFQQYLPRLFGDWSDVRFQEGERELVAGVHLVHPGRNRVDASGCQGFQGVS